MVSVRGLENPSTACHVSCPVIMLAYTLKPLAEAIIKVAPLRTESAFWQAWARVLEELQSYGHTTRCTSQGVDPTHFYQKLEKTSGIKAYELGDAITSLLKLFNILRDDPVLAQIVNKLLYTGRCVSVIRGRKYDPTSETLLRRRKWTKEKSLPVPFHVACSTMEADESVSLEQALRKTLSYRPIQGYQWSGSYEEDVVSSNEANSHSVENQWQTGRQLKIRALPPFWLIHTDQFSSIEGRVRPIQRPCEIPLRLDVAKLLHIDGGYGEYRLVGAILHLSNPDAKGDEEDGHYVSVVNSSMSYPDDWVLVDDSSVTHLSEETCLSLLAGCETSLSKNGTYMQACLLAYEHKEVAKDIESMIKDVTGQADDVVQRGESLVGRRLKVLWKKERYYEGVVASFEHGTGKHTICYDDGDIRTYNLSKKTIQWLDKE